MPILRTLATLLALALASTAYAEPDSPTTEHKQEQAAQPIENKGIFGFTIGYSHNVVTRFEIDNPNAEAEENKNRATFSGTSSAPYLTLTSGNLIPNDLHWQMIIEIGHSEFELDTQEYDGNKYDYGTSMKGSHTYIMPQIMYNTSPIGTHPNVENGLRVGAGLGIGRLQARGTARYTDKTTRNSANPEQIHNIDIDETGLSLKGFVEYRVYGFVLGTTIKIVIADGTDDSGNTNSYALSEVGINAGYSIHF